jgi:hypothetical protein
MSFEDQIFSTGIFTVPHGIFDAISDGYISKSAGVLLILLLHFENRKTETPNTWFDCDDREIYRTGFISQSTIRSARNCLKEHSWIDFKVGTKHKPTSYKINISPEHYYKQWFRGKNRRAEDTSSQ